MKKLIVESMRKLFTACTAAMAIGGSFMGAAPAIAETYYLVLGTYKQPDSSGKPRVAQYSSPSVQVIPMVSLEQCESAGEQITEEIYKPIWYFDGRWTCVEGK
tara:strand:- start:252 stop:560 length:309 start_codon:yes stop_codon:yes gene_type:complete